MLLRFFVVFDLVSIILLPVTSLHALRTWRVLSAKFTSSPTMRFISSAEYCISHKKMSMIHDTRSGFLYSKHG